MELLKTAGAPVISLGMYNSQANTATKSKKGHDKEDSK
jgi:hypothetical protein